MVGSPADWSGVCRESRCLVGSRSGVRLRLASATAVLSWWCRPCRPCCHWAVCSALNRPDDTAPLVSDQDDVAAPSLVPDQDDDQQPE